MSDENQGTVCSVCGKEIAPEDAGKIWRRCEWCKKPICFDCARYFGVHTSGLYHDYIKVVRVCKRCYPEKTLTP